VGEALSDEVDPLEVRLREKKVKCGAGALARVQVANEVLEFLRRRRIWWKICFLHGLIRCYGLYAGEGARATHDYAPRYLRYPCGIVPVTRCCDFPAYNLVKSQKSYGKASTEYEGTDGERSRRALDLQSVA
jgi:hypothetical protein